MKRFGYVFMDNYQDPTHSIAVESFKILPRQKLFIGLLTSEMFLKAEECLKIYGSHIEKIYIEHSDTDEMLSLFPLVPNLNDLMVHSLSEAQTHRKSKVDIPNLKILEVVTGNEFISFIGLHKIEKLIISETRNDEKWKEFLVTCNELKELVLNRIFFNFKLKCFNFRLTKFVLNDQDYQTFQHEDLREFLLTQRETLRILKLTQNHHDGLFEFVAFNLEVVEFSCDVSLEGLIERQKFNKTIIKQKIFISNVDYSSLSYYRKVFWSLLAIEALELEIIKHINEEEDSIVFEIIKLVASSMPKLKSLVLKYDEGLSSVPAEALRGIRLKQIEFLGTTSITNQIIQLFPNVKKLHFNGNISGDVLESILQSQIHLEEIATYDIMLDVKTVELLINSHVRKIICKPKDSREPPVMHPLIEKLNKSNIVVEYSYSYDKKFDEIS